MSYFLERLADAEFNIRVPLCHKCKNHFMLKFNPKNPLKELTQCKVYNGDAPEELTSCRKFECDYFQLDPEKAKIYEGLK